jgi:hypothetical protein
MANKLYYANETKEDSLSGIGRFINGWSWCSSGPRICKSVSTAAGEASYCLTMISDGTKSKEVDDLGQTLDVAEIVARAL